jgi:hypothetical protein
MIGVKYMSLLVTLMVITVLIIPVSTAAADNPTESGAITETAAKNVAQYYVNGYSKVIPEWTDGIVSNLITYYSDDEVISAYEFTVIKDDRPTGFIVISARKDWMPLYILLNYL